jgi:NADH dehydrogenase
VDRLRVVVVGGGFGGITAAKALAKQPVDVTLVDRHNFHTFSPLLYQVATSGLAPDDIAPSLRGIVQSHPNVDAWPRCTVSTSIATRCSSTPVTRSPTTC